MQYTGLVIKSRLGQKDGAADRDEAPNCAEMRVDSNVFDSNLCAVPMSIHGLSSRQNATSHAWVVCQWAFLSRTVALSPIRARSLTCSVIFEHLTNALLDIVRT